jgi:hypothetical protein
MRARRERPVVRTSAVTLLALLAIACGGAARPATAPLAVDPTRFPHDLHRGERCEACHGDAGAPRRPGHAACSAEGCHPAVTATTPDLFGDGRWCLACHAIADGGDGVVPTALPLPRLDSYVAMPSRFSHQLHLDADLTEAAVGFHVSCSDCHPAPAGSPTLPAHAACARCHADEVALLGGPSMSACAGCHDPAPSPRHATRLIRDDLTFDHAPHRRDLAGAAIGCAACHGGARQADRRDQMAPPAVSDCVGCHDDARRVTPAKRMRICETCHRGMASQLASLAPRSHLPPTDRPDDHTLSFRFDHAAAATSQTARCAGCHTQMSGQPSGTCDECHQTMRPRDHNVAWQELDHGQRAATDRDRCATCHVVDYCVACHAQRPRSHLPLGSFAGAGHAAPARSNPRACATCHDIDDDCASCHVGGAHR